jgi:hypothetical protein
VLAVAYALQVEDLAREVQAMTLAASVVLGMGGEAERPSWGELREEFDEMLSAPMQGERESDGSPRAIKMRALGVA